MAGAILNGIAKAAPYAGRGASALWGGIKSAWNMPWTTGRVATASAAGTGLLIADNQTGNVTTKALWDSADAVGLAKLYFSSTTYLARQVAGPVANIAKSELEESGVINENTDTDISNNLILAGSHYLTGDDRGALLLASNIGINEVDFLAAIDSARKENPDGDIKNTVISTYTHLEERIRAAHLNEDLAAEVADDTPAVNANEQASPGSVAGTQMERILKERQEGGGTLNLNQQSPDQIAQVFRSLTGMDTAGIDLTQDTKTWSKSAVSKAFDLAENHGSKLGLGIGFSIVAWGVNALSSAFGQESWLAQGAQKWALDHFEIDDKLLALQNDIYSGNYVSLGVSERRFDRALKSLVIDHTPDDPALENS